MEDYYPGSKRTRKQYDKDAPVTKAEQKEAAWDDNLSKPKIFLVNGQPTELYPLGAVATALNRKPVTIRRWESEGIIPHSPFMMPSRDPRGQRRLYTRQQIDALRRIAEEEGVLNPLAGGKWKPIETTDFRRKALAAFQN